MKKRSLVLLFGVTMLLGACTESWEEESQDAFGADSLNMEQQALSSNALSSNRQGEKHVFFASEDLDAVQRRPSFPVKRVRNPHGKNIPAALLTSAQPEPLLPSESVPDLAAQLLEHDPNEVVSAMVHLEDPPFDFKQLSMDHPNVANRGHRIQARKNSLQPLQAPVVAYLNALGASEVNPVWVVNSIIIEAEASLLTEIEQHPLVDRVEISVPFQPAHYNNMEVARRNPDNPSDWDEVFTGARHIHDIGIKGQTGNRKNQYDPIHYSVIEFAGSSTNRIVKHHTSWLTTDSGPCQDWCESHGGICINEGTNGLRCYTGNRLLEVVDCNGALGCYEHNYSGDSTEHSHGEAVTSLLLGSLIGSSFSGGMIPQAVGKYYMAHDGCGDLLIAFQDVLENLDRFPTDIINFSNGDPKAGCSARGDFCGLSDVIQKLTDAGVLIVSAAGNDGDKPPCNIWFPCALPDVLCVGALDIDYYSRLLDSSEGPIKIRQLDGKEVTTPGVDIVAPGEFGHPSPQHQDQWFPNSSPANIDRLGSAGTSFSTPLVAGAAGLLREAWVGQGAQMSPRELLVNMLLMGDGRHSTRPMPWYEWNFSGLDNGWGVGAMKLRVPDSKSLTPPWGWGYRSFVLHEGEMVHYSVGSEDPEGKDVFEWKWALSFFDESLTSTSHINIWVVNSCPEDPSLLSEVLQYDTSSDLRKRITLRDWEIWDKCLEMYVYADKAPKDGVLVVSADAYHATPFLW